jgi:hypothetical protein
MLKSKYNQRKLTLSKQTIRALTSDQLRGAAGGLPTDPLSEGDGTGDASVGNSRCNGCSFFSVSQC